MYIRPLESRRDNLIEIVNETIFTLLSTSLLYLNQEEDWGSVLKSLYMYTIVANTLLISIIMTGKFDHSHFYSCLGVANQGKWVQV